MRLKKVCKPKFKVCLVCRQKCDSRKAIYDHDRRAWACWDCLEKSTKTK